MNTLAKKFKSILRKLRQLRILFAQKQTPKKIGSELHLGLNKEVRIQIENLMDLCECRNPVVLLRYSLATYDVLTEHIKEGGEIFLKYPDGTSCKFDPISFMEDEPEK